MSRSLLRNNINLLIFVYEELIVTLHDPAQIFPAIAYS